MGVSLVNRTTLKALFPEITRKIAWPISFLINLRMEETIIIYGCFVLVTRSVVGLRVVLSQKNVNEDIEK